MRRSRVLALALTALAAVVLAAPAADARPRRPRGHKTVPKGGRVERTVTRTAPDGRTSSTHDELQRTDGGYTRETTHTDRDGDVTTRNANGTWDPVTKTWTREKVVTRPDGSTATTGVTRQLNPAAPEPAPAE